MSTQKSERQLKQLYQKFNALYFGGELPNARVFYEPISGFANCTYTEDEGFVIRLNTSIGGWLDFIKLTLLHECIHGLPP